MWPGFSSKNSTEAQLRPSPTSAFQPAKTPQTPSFPFLTSGSSPSSSQNNQQGQLLPSLMAATTGSCSGGGSGITTHLPPPTPTYYVLAPPGTSYSSYAYAYPTSLSTTTPGYYHLPSHHEYYLPSPLLPAPAPTSASSSSSSAGSSTSGGAYLSTDSTSLQPFYQLPSPSHLGGATASWAFPQQTSSGHYYASAHPYFTSSSASVSTSSASSASLSAAVVEAAAAAAAAAGFDPHHSHSHGIYQHPYPHLPSSPLSSLGGDDKPAAKRKKKRRHKTIEELKVLEDIFLEEKFPNRQMREELAKNMCMTPRQVQMWFQNRRAKEKKLQALGGGTTGKVHKVSEEDSPSAKRSKETFSQREEEEKEEEEEEEEEGTDAEEEEEEEEQQEKKPVKKKEQP